MKIASFSNNSSSHLYFHSIKRQVVVALIQPVPYFIHFDVQSDETVGNKCNKVEGHEKCMQMISLKNEFIK